MKTIKQKLINYLSFKDISQDQFSRDCNVASGFLRQGKSFSTDLLPIIRDKYPDLNMNWLIYNEGEMQLTADMIVSEPANHYGNNDCKQMLKEYMQRVIVLQDKVITLQERLNILAGNKDINDGK